MHEDNFFVVLGTENQYKHLNLMLNQMAHRNRINDIIRVHIVLSK